jgi:PAS domain S-box-containing protein
MSDKPLHFEDNVDLSGKPGWYLSTFTRVLNANGVIDGIQVIAENITKRKLAELDIRKNEEQLNLIFSTMSEGVALNEAIYDECGNVIDYRIIMVNNAYYKLADYIKGINVIGNTATKVYGMESETIAEWWKDHKSMNETIYSQYYSPMSNKWYMISTSPLTADKFVTTFTDISDRKITEEKLRTASLYARTLLEASLDPLVTISHEGKITDVNHATEKITGVKRNKLIGSEFANYFVETEKAREGYNIVFSKGAVKDFSLTIRHKNGRTADILYNATLFKNEAGEVQGVFAAARDITVRKKMEIKLRNSQKLLQNLNQHLHEVRENERSQIAMNLHDDLGQRLTALYLDVSWIKGRIGVQSAKVRTRLDEMGLEINEAIDGIKELSSILRPTILYDLGLVPAIISQLNKFESQSGIKCYFYFDSEEFNVSEKISLIFYRTIQESLTNIARHSGASAMELSLKKLKNAIEVIIRDDGIGIEESKISSMQSMGLQGIRERVESAHGEVSIKGEKGSGTTITVTIPTDKSNL